MVRKPPRKKDVIVPTRYLEDPRDATHKFRLSLSLDCEAIDLAADALVSMGHTRGRSIYLRPYTLPVAPDAPLPVVPMQRPLSPEMRFLVGSRPPLFEDKEAYPRVRKSSYHELEHALNEVWRPYFKLKRRDLLELAPDIADLLETEYANRRYIEFYKRQGSHYVRLADGRLPAETRACGFVLNQRDFYQGASLTSFFAMDGLMCLVMSTLIAERHPRWLEEPGFRMIEVIGSRIQDGFESLDFVDGWELISVLHYEG